MRPSLTTPPKRTADKARAAAEGSAVPAGTAPPSPDAAETPGSGERGSMRRRMRRLRRTREVLLRELGALVVETRRLGRENVELVGRKSDELIAIDRELRGLRAALGERHTVAQVVAAGVAGSCARCGTILGTDDRFCSHCGLGVSASAEPVATGPVVVAPEGPVVAGGKPEPGAEPEVAAAEKPEAAEPAAAAPPPPPPPSPPPPPAPELSPAAATQQP